MAENNIPAFPSIVHNLVAVFCFLIGVVVGHIYICDPGIKITATGNNGDGTINFEYRISGKTKSHFHMPVDTFLHFLREQENIK